MGVRFDKVAVVQRDVPTELQRRADATVVVVALGFLAIAELNLGLILEAVVLEYAVKVVTALAVQPGGVRANVVAVDRAVSATTQVQIGLAVAAQQTDQPLPVTDRQRRVGTERKALLGLLVSHSGTGVDIELVAVGTNPATRLAFVHTHFAHATTQGAELAVPDGRRCIEQCQY